MSNLSEPIYDIVKQLERLNAKFERLNAKFERLNETLDEWLATVMEK